MNRETGTHNENDDEESVPLTQWKRELRLNFPFRSSQAFSVSLRTFDEVDVKRKKN